MRALISVYDKIGLVEFARELVDLGWELVSTGGSAATLTGAGLPVTEVESLTGFPEMLDGRVKTLHPNIHGALLARRDLPEHMETLDQFGISPIDMLVSNLYPFEKSVQDAHLDDKARIEQIDIGGPAMVRAASKNFSAVTVIVDPADYIPIVTALRTGHVDLEARRALAAKAFGHVSTYDALVAQYLRGPDSLFPDELSIPLRRAATPRYGENPQQPAAVYRRLGTGAATPGILDAVRISGDPLSFNNFLDTDAAWNATGLFTEPAVCIVKHMVPCGLAVRSAISDAYAAAFDGDPMSAFGGIVSLNRAVDLPTAEQMRKIKLDIIIAPAYDDEALAVLQRKKGTRLLTLDPQRPETSNELHELDVRPISGGMLVQVPDRSNDDPSTWKVVTQVQPTDQQFADLAFAWQAVRLVKSNAIVVAKDSAVAGVGAGQPNRVESVNLATAKAGNKAKGAALASDAFFPFGDSIELAASHGIATVIQPGGSMRDEEVIAAADAAGIAMIFTGTRHFRH
ncbi:MAG TPA: bifunctional phosphoribosylaminoimidazolecarboxamide formyltransferase/IMP cyclohydrolase [Thermomicrobiales bacterium]|nr:bifunctional phosphoribosylaminoimidazolecarboxamide formyltransferase/IMP cyclohydrolase [Thermomicrobiales bacterium]